MEELTAGWVVYIFLSIVDVKQDGETTLRHHFRRQVCFIRLSVKRVGELLGNIKTWPVQVFAAERKLLSSHLDFSTNRI